MIITDWTPQKAAAFTKETLEFRHALHERPMFDDAGLAEDHPTRPDGVHFSPEAAERVASDWLGPLLVNAAVRGR